MHRTALPPLGFLTNPHLLVSGGAWRSPLLRYFAATTVQQGAHLVAYLGDVPVARGAGCVVAARSLDLTEALRTHGGDGLAQLRSILAQVAGSHEGIGESTAVLQALDRVMSRLTVTPVDHPVSQQVLAVDSLWSGLSKARAAGLLADLIDHARTTGLPHPVVRRIQGHITIALDPQAAVDALFAEDLSPDALLVSIPVRKVGGESDWQPYAAGGVRPALRPQDLEVAIEVTATKLAAKPEYRRADAEVLSQLATAQVQRNQWPIAIGQADPFPPQERGYGLAAVLTSLAAELPVAQRGVVDQVRAMLVGERAMPIWWQGLWVIEDDPASAVRAPLIIDSLLAQADGLNSTRKVVLISCDRLITHEASCYQIERLLRLGRKLNVQVILLVADHRALPAHAATLVSLCPNRLFAVEVADIPAPDAQDPPVGWLRLSETGRDEPLATFWEPAQIALGDRLLQGHPLSPT